MTRTQSRYFVWKGMAAGFCVVLFLFFTVGAAGAQGPDAKKTRTELQQQLDQLQRDADALGAGIQQVQGEKRTLDNEVKSLNAEVKQRELEIRRLALTIRQTEIQIEIKEGEIKELSQRIDKNKDQLAASLFQLDLYDRTSMLSLIGNNDSLSGFFSALNNLDRVQGRIKGSITVSKEERRVLGEKKSELEEFQDDQQNLKALQEVERRFLAQKKKEKDELLRLTKGKESLFQQLLSLKKRDITSLRNQLFYLERTGITAEDAVKYADLAAKRAGIRTAFLLALLEVETGKQFEDGVISVGTNLGTGNWKRDLYDCFVNLRKRGTAEAEKNAFFKITSGLGFDPDKMPVSRKPNYGCGGAMGPAQFLPTTWLRFSGRVADLTGHKPPSPWSVEDAFTASALFLADSGATAQTPAAEARAARTYISGNPSCVRAICSWYANRIASLAKDINKIL